jgi:hypothetical protein
MVSRSVRFCIGTINHSEQVMRVITWNRSFKGPHGLEDGNDDMQGKEKETHASVLDKLLAWENKLYDEVKVCELSPLLRMLCFHLILPENLNFNVWDFPC